VLTAAHLNAGKLEARLAARGLLHLPHAVGDAKSSGQEGGVASRESALSTDVSQRRRPTTTKSPVSDEPTVIRELPTTEYIDRESIGM